MEIKDRLVSWFVQNIAMPQMEIINKPGFVVTQFSEKKQAVFLREIFFPEFVFAELEKRIVEKFGEKGAKLLYSAGKNFGYRYSTISLFPRFKRGQEKKFDSFLYMFMRYMESMWSEEITYKYDLKVGTLEINAKNFVVCGKSGFGHIIPQGVGAGFWNYLMGDNTIEGMQKNCIGKGDKKCILFYSPSKYLEDQKLSFISSPLEDFTRLEKIDPSYNQINMIREPQFSNMSFKDMLDAKFFDYKNGIVMLKDHRHFLCESSIFYFLEENLSKIKGGNEILFQICYEYGKDISEHAAGNAKKFISDYMSSIGWGDVTVLEKEGKYRVISNYFPWVDSFKIEFTMFRGIVSGILSAVEAREIKLSKFSQNLSSGFMVLETYE